LRFQNAGQLQVTLAAADFRNNETQPKLVNVGCLRITG